MFFFFTLKKMKGIGDWIDYKIHRFFVFLILVFYINFIYM